MEKSIKELVSPSGKYKAVITEKNDYFTIDIYLLAEDYDAENDQSYGEYWSRKNKEQILIDKGFSPEYFAIQELRQLIGEPGKILTIEWIRDYSFCQKAVFLDPESIRVYYDGRTEKDIIKAKTIINFEDLCLVEEFDSNDDWLMGQVDADGSIVCWGSYGNIKEAIKGL